MNTSELTKGSCDRCGKRSSDPTCKMCLQIPSQETPIHIGWGAIFATFIVYGGVLTTTVYGLLTIVWVISRLVGGR